MLSPTVGSGPEVFPLSVKRDYQGFEMCEWHISPKLRFSPNCPKGIKDNMEEE